MKPISTTLALFATLMCAALVQADKKPAKIPKITEETRMTLIRGLNAEMVFIRRPFPMGKTGLTIKDGKVSPSEEQVARMVASYGPAVKPGDRAHITNIQFKGDKTIVFEINGGPVKKKKWFEHLQIGGAGGMTQVKDPGADPNANPRGSYVALEFDHYVPEMSIEQVKTLLKPVFDFNAKSAAEAYLDTLPPKLKLAIKNHQVLVGMNREMVTYALGRPPKKYRQEQGGTQYEEWIYGQPPQEVKFVRFVGDEVVRLEIMQVDGEKVVRTQREIDIRPTLAKQQEAQREKAEAAKPMKRPTLRRPGEAAPDNSDGMGKPLPRDRTNRPDSPAPPIPGNTPPGSGTVISN
jgi:outer membrane protein assembly factor BamE (lipoprotein component of BamABCDE complex)